MNTQEIVKEQKTITQAQWDEISKFAQIGKIKNALADLLEMAPELELDTTIEFIHGLVIREMKSREMKPKVRKPAETLVQGLERTLNDWSNR